MSDIATRTGEQFARDTARHELTVKHDDGLYRHLMCRRSNSGLYHFEVVTWPGALLLRGDIDGAYCFRRLDDMFAFFRSDGAVPNLHYWSEKLAGGRNSVLEHSADVARQMIAEAIGDYEEGSYPYLLGRWDASQSPRGAEPVSPATARALVADCEEDGDLDHAHGLRNLLSELEAMGVASDTWEWDCRDWSPSFVWACHAIVWAIARYDAQRKADGGESS